MVNIICRRLKIALTFLHAKMKDLEMNSDVHQTLITLSDLHAKFGWEEYIVLATTLAISGLIGVFWAWRSRKEESKLMNA